MAGIDVEKSSNLLILGCPKKEVHFGNIGYAREENLLELMLYYSTFCVHALHMLHNLCYKNICGESTGFRLLILPMADKAVGLTFEAYI